MMFPVVSSFMIRTFNHIPLNGTLGFMVGHEMKKMNSRRQ